MSYDHELPNEWAGVAGKTLAIKQSLLVLEVFREFYAFAQILRLPVAL